MVSRGHVLLGLLGLLGHASASFERERSSPHQSTFETLVIVKFGYDYHNWMSRYERRELPGGMSVGVGSGTRGAARRTGQASLNASAVTNGRE
ncbi:unnamed protein product [Danaus chrysippus]|uniref:(African queen) hypothetical protein n=1 Tax=Danaus chrysippus TaxID=151541 RepID=A0A8J2VZD1_9NEOP|nr:unnamed protein product [Danaus chrysippus]